MNKEKLLEIERNFRALIDSLTAEELEAELRRIEETVSEYERFISALREAGLGSVAIEVLPDDEAEDNEGEHAENL
nr:MAG TPA: hypothetical protein [Caudoviricetes sp.]